MDSTVVRAIATCGIFMLAILGCIVVALLEHQRKMAEIMRKDRNANEGLDGRVDALQAEIRELKSALLGANALHKSPEEQDLKSRLS